MRCLDGVRIVFGNTAPHNTEDLADTASVLGAAILSPCSASQATYVVASSVLRLPDGSDPYLASFQCNSSLLVVSPEWLSVCQAEQCQVQPGPYVLGPFAGIKVSITNFGAKERDAVVQQLKQGAANYSPELFRHTTHLVGNRPGGNKYTHARDWGLLIVHHDWVLDSLKAGRRLDERPYNLESYASKDGASAGLASGGDYQRQPSRTTSSTRCAVTSYSGGGGDGAGAPGASAPVRQATASIRGVVAPGPTDSVTGAAAGHGGAAPGRGSGGALRPANGLPAPGSADDVGGKGLAGGPGGGAGAGGAPYQQMQPIEQYYHIPAVPPDDCYFLHWVRLWVVGCTPSEQSHVLAAVRESGATREPALHGGVTHIVFGSVLSTADLAEVRHHLAEHREQVKLARLRWLYECVERRSYIEPEGPLAMTVAQLLLAQGGGGGGGTGAGQLMPAQSGRLGQRSREGSPALLGGGGSTSSAATAMGMAAGLGGAGRVGAPPPLDDYVPLDPEANNRTMDSISVRGSAAGVFSGLWFTLVAVAGGEEESAATRLVRQGGGMIMSASTERTVREPERRYAVCPFSLPQPTVDRLCSGRGRERGQSEFERVPDAQRVTVAWLRACVGRGELLPVKRETPLFRPLPHALPLPRFQGLTLAVSQYHVEQREVLEQLISRLGGTYTEKLNKRCHYLVIQDAHGEKFTHAIKWGIPCVRADWVLESAIAGRPLDDQLIAFLPAGITPAELEEKRAAASRARGAGGGCGPSQLGPTQRPQASQLPSTMPARGFPGSSQFQHTDGRGQVGALSSGLPPRPGHAPDRYAGPTQMPATAKPAARSGAPPPLPMAPPRTTPASAAMAAVGPLGEALPAAAPALAAAGRSRSVLAPFLEGILGDDVGDTEEVCAPGAVTACGAAVAAETSQGQLSGNLAFGGNLASAPAHPQPAPAGVAGPAGHASTPAAGVRDVGGSAAAGPAVQQQQHLQAPAPRPDQQLSAAAADARERQVEAAARELDGATALLMQFLDNNQFVPDMAASQLDLPLQLPPLPAMGCGDGSLTGAGASSLSSRDGGGSGLSLLTGDGDGGGGGIGARRSRKRAAAAAVGEMQGAPGKVGGLPGRRTRNDEEEEGFGVAMSQQVSYEAVAAAPPPRATRSMTRGGKGAGGSAAKENLIKAVQGNMR